MIELLSTKLFIPRPRKNLVSRPRLVERLNTGLDKKLSLIAAPAGFGKTTLLSEWIPQSPRCVTWLSLDEADNDSARFWTYFISSLQGLRPDFGKDALALLQSPQAPPINSTLTTLINEITTFPDTFALVLDDYHLIDAQQIHEALAFLIEHLPANMHLVITTRVDPALPLARLRVRDQLTEIRVKNLRFTRVEAESFLNLEVGERFTPEEVAALEERTEGWIAGLQIAALSIQGYDDISGFIQVFSGGHRHILGYLADEVLNQRPKGTLDFLLQTSILDRLCGPLCDAVMGGSEGQAILENLAQANLFISPLDDEGKWYRYHHLFAEVLQLRLKQTDAGLIPILHSRAREWLENNELSHEAIRHAIAGGDFEHAAHLVERQLSANWLKGELKTLQGWLSAIPVSFWRIHPRLWLVQAWVAMTVGDLVEADANLKAAEEALDLLDEELASKLRPEVLAFRASYASLVQSPHAIELVRQALEILPKDHWIRGMLVVFLGSAYYSAGNLDSALEALTHAPVSAQSTSRIQPHRVHVLAFGGMVYYAKGQLREALKLLYKAVEQAEPGGIPIPYVGTLLAYMSLVPVLYERNELDQAGAYLERCLEMATNFGSAEVQIYVLSLLACICMTKHDLPTAISYYEKIDALLQEHVFSPSIMAYVNYHRFQLYLEQMNTEAAATWVEAHKDTSGPLNSYALHRIASPQFLIAQGQFDAASKELTTLVKDAQEAGHGNLLVKALTLQALAYKGCGNQANALSILEHVLSLSEPEGYIRIFLDEGEAMYLLLQEYQSSLKNKIGGGIDNETVRLLTYIDRLLAAFSQFRPSEKSVQTPLLEPLSERELDILRLIATGRSNQEIADVLVIALSTVKSHINNLYSKLGTNRRTQAIAISSDLGLLSE